MEIKRGARWRMVCVRVIVGAAIGLVLATGGCSVSFRAEPPSPAPARPAPTVSNPAPSTAATAMTSGAEVAGVVSEQLTQMVGLSPDSVTCPQDLPASVGATIRCQLRDGWETYGVTVTTTLVNDTGVRFDFEVDKAPSPR